MLNNQILKGEPSIKEPCVHGDLLCLCKWRLLCDVLEVCQLCCKEELQMPNIKILVFSTQSERNWVMAPSTIAISQ